MITSDGFKICCDEKPHASVSDIDLFADIDANNNPQSSFSIRNFVFNSRNKNIACNWPFSHKTLQFCLQHEVRNILPPFQSLESLRTNSSNEEIISSCDGNSNSNPELSLESRKSKKSQTNRQQELGQTTSKKPVLGCSRKTETEISMGSKICPVCKVFSSSSNTTLNAHIDQCLSGESSMKWTANSEVVIKHRIKPRKMRLMVDIYKTAPHCTAEELDARNGTSLLNNSSFPDQEIEFQHEQEKEAPAATAIVDHGGDVYINNNRAKVRIFSVPKVDSNTSNDDGAQKKGWISVKVSLGKKKDKNKEPKHDQKCLKQSPNSKKSSSEVAAGPDKNVDDEECCNKEPTDKKDDLPIERPPWACSKRTVVAKKNSSVAGDKSFSKSGFKLPSSSSNKTRISPQQNSQKMGTLTPKKAHFVRKRFLLSTKPRSKQFKKHNSCRVKESDVRSKGRPSSRENLLSVSVKTESKINLKRKFSALERVMDSLKQKSGVEEDTSGKTSCESMNLLEVKKNEKMETCRPENSVSSRSLNETMDPSCDVESVRDKTRSNKEQVSTMQVPRERVIDVTQQHYNDMSDSPISTISNPSLTRSESDKFSVRSTSRNVEKFNEKYALGTLTSSNDWRSKGQSQSQTTSFKNDNQPCCCSRKEIASTYYNQSTILRKHDVESFNFWPPPPMKLPPYRECNSAAGPSKPVIRLMGKNLAVVNTDEDKVNCGYQFPNSYQNGFKFQPNDSLKNHALATMFQNTTYADYYVPANQDSKNSLAFNNGGFQTLSRFMEVENTKNLAKWNCKPTGCSRSSAIYYPSSFS